MKNIFSCNIDINKTAYMNWRIDKHDGIHNLVIIADGYIKSSLILANSVLDEGNHMKQADIVIYPILFNANHAIELYLKAILWTLNILLDNGKKIEGSHNIEQIFNVVKKRVNEYETDKNRRKHFKEFTQGLQEYIDELIPLINYNDGKKDKMDFSRYPFSTDYTNHFYVETFDNVTIDLENFIARFKEIGTNLKTICEHYLYDHLEPKIEYEVEMRKEYDNYL